MFQTCLFCICLQQTKMAAFHLNHGTCRKPDYIHLAGNPLTGPKLARGVLQRWLGARYQPQVWRNRGVEGVGRGVGFYDHGILVNFCVGSARKGLKDVRGLAFVVGRPGRLGSVRSVTNLQLSGSETFTWIISWALAKFRNSLIPRIIVTCKTAAVKMPKYRFQWASIPIR